MRGMIRLGAVVLLSLAAAAAAAGAEPQAGRDYVAVVAPQPTSDAKRIVVTEFFSYACPHCAAFYPVLASIKSFVSRGDQLAKTYRIAGVPTLVVDGKYMVEIQDDGVYVGQLTIVDQLIAKARAERAKAQ